MERVSDVETVRVRGCILVVVLQAICVVGHATAGEETNGRRRLRYFPAERV
jgi:hypothetical protein